MALKDALERLQRRLDEGQISRREYEEAKERLKRTDVVVSPFANLNLFLGKHFHTEVVRGTVRTIASQEGWLTIDVDGHRLFARAIAKNPQQISPGNTVVVLVNTDNYVAQGYHNETTGSNDLGLLRTRYRRAGLSAIGFTSVAFAIFATVFVAASRERLALPASVLIHTPLYLLSMLGGGLLLLIALLCLAAWGVFFRIHETMRAIVAGDVERALKRARRWLPKPKR